jgi:predicted MFS family arabinose efflux permease
VLGSLVGWRVTFLLLVVSTLVGPPFLLRLLEPPRGSVAAGEPSAPLRVRASTTS